MQREYEYSKATPAMSLSVTLLNCHDSEKSMNEHKLKWEARCFLEVVITSGFPLIPDSDFLAVTGCQRRPLRPYTQDINIELSQRREALLPNGQSKSSRNGGIAQ
jgi:hypothetical protein